MRLFILVLTVGITVLAFGAEPKRPPNIVLILGDDIGCEWISAYGAKGIQTPAIDALARDGVLFETCYATPLCTPSRVTLLTGRYPSRTGWTTHNDTVRYGGRYFDWEKETSFPRLLRMAGYATAIAGKWQVNDLRVQPDAITRHGFDEYCLWPGEESPGSEEGTPRYWDPVVVTNGRRSTEKGKYGPDVHRGFLLDFMRRHRDRPFFAYYSMVLGHAPFVSPPGSRTADNSVESIFADMIRYMDREVAEIVDAVDRLGLRENTLFIFATDNGTHPRITGHGKDGEVKGGKRSLKETGIRVPLIFRGAGVIAAGRRTDALSDITDLSATILERAGVTRHVGQTDGKSLVPVLANTGIGPRKWAFSEYRGVRVIRDHRHKLYSDGRLFDLLHDPAEESVLQVRPDDVHAEARARLQAALVSLELPAVAPAKEEEPE